MWKKLRLLLGPREGEGWTWQFSKKSSRQFFVSMSDPSPNLQRLLESSLYCMWLSSITHTVWKRLFFYSGLEKRYTVRTTLWPAVCIFLPHFHCGLYCRFQIKSNMAILLIVREYCSEITVWFVNCLLLTNRILNILQSKIFLE